MVIMNRQDSHNTYFVEHRLIPCKTTALKKINTPLMIAVIAASVTSAGYEQEDALIGLKALGANFVYAEKDVTGNIEGNKGTLKKNHPVLYPSEQRLKRPERHPESNISLSRRGPI